MLEGLGIDGMGLVDENGIPKIEMRDILDKSISEMTGQAVRVKMSKFDFSSTWITTDSSPPLFWIQKVAQ